MKKSLLIINLIILCITGYSQKTCFSTQTNNNSVQFITDNLAGHIYNWNFGDGNTENNNPNPTHTYSNGNQLYDVQLIIDSSGVKDTLTKKVIVLDASTTSGTDLINEDFNTEFQLFPNPSSGKFTIQSLSDNQFDIKIINVNGEVISSFKLNGNQQVEITNWSVGLYFVQASDNKSFYTTKLNIQ